MTLFLDGRSLTLDDLARVARDPSTTVGVRPGDWAALERCTAVIDEIIARYRSDQSVGNRVYGVTTGYGEFKDRAIDPDRLNELSPNILLSHAVGFGVNEDPDDPANYLPAEVVRAALVLRINTFLKGHSGVRRELVEFMLAMVNSGVVPLAPLRGSVGSSGDLCPLAHLFATVIGVGRFYVATTADAVRRGMVHPDAMLHDAAALPKLLGKPACGVRPKEGLALTNGAVVSNAMLALAVVDAENLAATADAATALTLEAICGRLRPFDAHVHEARNMPGQIASAANVRALTKGSRLVGLRQAVQDPYSVRCAPAVQGASRDAIAFARRVAEAESNAATDNPLFFPDSVPEDTGPDRRPDASDAGRNHEGWAYSAGNFHGQPVGQAADFLAIAVAELASISERRTQMLLDKHHNHGLPANLIADPGVNSGFMLAQYTSAALVSENKILCHPSTVDSIPTSANIEDHVAMATTAARKVGQVIANTKHVLASELLVAAQAVEWRLFDEARGESTSTLSADFERLYAANDATGRTFVAARLGIGTRCVYQAIRSRIAPMVRDRLLEPMPRAIRTLIAEQAFAEIVKIMKHESSE